MPKWNFQNKGLFSFFCSLIAIGTVDSVFFSIGEKGMLFECEQLFEGRFCVTTWTRLLQFRAAKIFYLSRLIFQSTIK